MTKKSSQWISCTVLQTIPVTATMPWSFIYPNDIRTVQHSSSFQSGSVWYENRPLCVNKLAVMMREISKEAQLSSLYTNHCVRATAIALWSDEGLENCHIMAISGLRNEQSLKSYNSHPSLNANLQIGFNDPQPTQLFSHVTSMSQNTSVYHGSNFDNIFSSCSIGTVNLTVNPP